MNILAVDTALASCSVAVVQYGTPRSHLFEPMERGQAEALAPMVVRAMKSARLSFHELDRLGVTTGPGTFTGQRVGLAFMRAMRVALGRPIVGITTLAAMAHAAMAETGLSRAAAIHEARNGSVYLELCSLTGEGQGPIMVSLEDATRTVGDFLLAGPAALAGSARARLPLSSHLLSQGVMSEISLPDALWVARLAERATATDEPPAPLYLEAPAATISGSRG
ncbi:MAG: tRNA (adenosine(37)-N6)-threonylcarbamoyltransferase complex dimerization subunit type 1 TsaB [Alphaproteobacteria bacterium]|nr:tRNA (adenosine(37)-N6)-threonylcarbamoyltransferase complex dimerization subunit type 1 TsaB [Alphaproteobacteria bacterium]